ncbi:unnamed protein product [Heligmosomoides polygyrus]|uniref:Protein FAM122A n=1 Tax=Heligmosomoides polygyrus TaxID=6339 RepID=A0A183G2B9_HELPZ|nr:unnamed protein product [Heligmosomoides polygyrus]
MAPGGTLDSRRDLNLTRNFSKRTTVFGSQPFLQPSDTPSGLSARPPRALRDAASPSKRSMALFMSSNRDRVNTLACDVIPSHQSSYSGDSTVETCWQSTAP